MIWTEAERARGPGLGRQDGRELPLLRHAADRRGPRLRARRRASPRPRDSSLTRTLTPAPQRGGIARPGPLAGVRCSGGSDVRPRAAGAVDSDLRRRSGGRLSPRVAGRRIGGQTGRRGVAWRPCNEPVPVRDGEGAARLRPAPRRDDLARACAPARDRPHAADRLARCSTRAARAARASTSCWTPARSSTPMRCVRRFDLVGFDPRGIVRSAPAAVLRQPGGVGAVLHAVRVPA